MQAKHIHYLEHSTKKKKRNDIYKSNLIHIPYKDNIINIWENLHAYINTKLIINYE